MNRRQEGEKTRTTIIRIIGDRPSRAMSVVAFFYVVQRLNQRKELSVETNVLALNKDAGIELVCQGSEEEKEGSPSTPRLERQDERLGTTRRASCGRGAGRAIHVGRRIVIPPSQ